MLSNHQVGYREGITAGKESALQQGFDDGFAQVGAPLGREIGILRGFAAALLSFLNSPSCSLEPTARPTVSQEVRAISLELNRIRFSDIAPPDLEAEQHAREHLEAAGADGDNEIVSNEEVQLKRDVEGLEDMMNRMSADTVQASQLPQRPTAEDVSKLAGRLQALAGTLGFSIPAG